MDEGREGGGGGREMEGGRFLRQRRETEEREEGRW